MLLPGPYGEEAPFLVLRWDFGGDEGFVRKKRSSSGPCPYHGAGRGVFGAIGVSGRSGAVHTHEKSDNPYNESDNSGYRP